MNARITLAMAAQLLLACAQVYSAETLCADTQSIDACYEEKVDKPAKLTLDDATLGAVDNSKKSVKATTTEAAKEDQAGAASAGPQARSTVTDLIPWLNMLGVLSDSDASDGTIAVDLNFLLPVRKKETANTDRDSQLKWAIDVEPAPFEALIAAVPESVRAQRKKELSEKIADTADSELQYSYSLVTRNHGRDFRRNNARLTALVAGPMLGGSGPVASARGKVVSAQREFRQDISAFVRRLGGDENPKNNLTLNEPLNKFELSKAEKDELESIIAKASKEVTPALADLRTQLNAVVTSPGLNSMATLVQMQPQLLFSATRRFRDEIVGPESRGFRVTYERSSVSLTEFFKDTTEKGCEEVEKLKSVDEVSRVDFVKADACYLALNAYMNDDKVLEQLNAESRWKAALEFKQVDDWRYAIPGDGVDLELPKHDRLTASVGIGRAITSSKGKDRVDFEVAFDNNLDDDDTYKNRFVVTLTYTRRFGEMDLPFSIVYANKSEFLEGTDKQIGLHFGIKYRALDKK